MIELYVTDFEETDLERALQNANFQYQICLDIGKYGLATPYLVANGIPLDKKRAMIWIKEQKGNG